MTVTEQVTDDNTEQNLCVYLMTGLSISRQDRVKKKLSLEKEKG